MKTLTNISLMIGSFILFLSNITAPDILVKKSIYEVYYSQKLEQPIWLVYKSTNRPTNVNRGSMDFWLEPQIKTSDGKDYEKNVWDKGHIAPAATFSDNMENLKTTFSYLNCALQNQYLNRGEWRLLEEQERKWDDKEFLTVKVSLDFDKSSIVLPTGATIPKAFTKHIYFETSKNWKCYYFLNEKPTKPWEEHQIKCSH
jgi:endonuclease G, mitochondrial